MKMNQGIVVLSVAAICLIAATTPTLGTVLFSSDLESEDSTHWASAIASGGTYNGWTLGGQGVLSLSNNGISHSGNKAIKVTFTHDEDVGMACRTITPSNHVFCRFYNYFTNSTGGNFDHAAGQKISLMSGRDDTGYVSVEPILYISAGMGNLCGINPMLSMSVAANGGYNSNDFDDIPAGGGLQSNRWYCIEWELQLNTVGQNNGVVRVWVDGVKVGEATNINMINKTSQFNYVMFGGWYSNSAGGENPCVDPAVPSIRYIDDCVISDSYIGPMLAVGPSVSSLVPDSTSVTGGKKIALNGTGFTGTTVKIGNGGYAGATSQTMTSVGSTVDTITSTAKSRGLYKVYVTDGSANVDSSTTIYFYKASLIYTPSSRTETQNVPSLGYVATDSAAGDPWDSIGFKTTLPTGLSLNHSTGAITGTPTVVQSATAYVFYAWKYGYKNDSATVTITITVATAAVLYDSSMTWQLSTNNFATTVLNVTTIDTNYIVITPLSYSTTYQFRVRNNNVDTNSVWSDTTTFTTMQMPVPDTVISVYPSVARIDALSTKAQRTIVVKEHGPNKCTVNTVIWLGTAPLGFNTLYTDSTVTDTLFKYPTLPIGTFRVYLTDPSWSPTVSDTLLSAIRLLNPSIIVTKP